MSAPNEGKQNDKPKDNSIPPVSSTNKESGQRIQSPHQGRQPAKQPKPEPPIYKRVITFFGKDTNQPTVANIISLLMVGITAVLAYYTWRVFNQTTIQSNAATKSANAAVRSADLQKQSLDSQMVAKKQSDISAAKKEKLDSQTFELQKSALNAQITAIKKNQENFEVQNKSYLQFNGIIFTKLEPGIPISYKFQLTNFGNNPAKIISKKIKVGFLPDINSINTKNKISKMLEVAFATAHTDSVSNYAKAEGIYFTENTTLFYSNAIRGNYGYGVFFYIIGKIEYVDLVTNKKGIYKFKAKIYSMSMEDECPYILF